VSSFQHAFQITSIRERRILRRKVAIFIIPVFGQTFGYYTRDMDGFKHDVILKGVEMQDVGVVMITSHHTVLYSDKGDVIVVPSADVNQIVKKAGASTAVVHPN
jgi:uncharacterized Fe-S cluster-containing protein